MQQKTIPELFDLKGQTAIVTGGAMGIGYGIVKRLSEAGANVVIADVAEDEGVKKAKKISDGGAHCVFINTDVTSERAVQNVIAETIKQFGKLDILVNDAGIFPQAPVLEMDLAFWEKTQTVNLRSVFLFCREAGKVMAKAGKGVIINIGSVDSVHPSLTGLAAYDASKHGIWGFTKNFALEVAKQGVRVNCIGPGGVATEGVKKMTGSEGDDKKFQEAMKAMSAPIPLGRIAEPDDIAKVALFLASDAAAYMTGTLTIVDGGTLLT